MKRAIIIFLTLLSFVVTKAQTLNCNQICVTDIKIDSLTGEMLVTIYNGDSVHINYPIVQVIDQNGDTVGNPGGVFNFFVQLSGFVLVHNIPTSLTSLPSGFTATVLVSDPLWNVSCSFSYPMNCTPDCDDLFVQDISMDSVAGTVDIKLFNQSPAWNGWPYCEMLLLRNISPFDTLAESNCFCLMTPNANTSQIYTLTANVNSLPPMNEMYIKFYCGGGNCDSLLIDPPLGIYQTKDEEIKIYPNPVNDFLTIYANGFKKGLLMDITGRIINQIEFNSTVTIIDMGELNSGIYILKCNEHSFKIMKK